ncbi:MAG: glycosyl hydrolase 115 family protein [Bacteroidaceae bacterium]|nr:glycosyl hydrolase 115 family protein [Bacteroidaceae bacterium]
MKKICCCLLSIFCCFLSADAVDLKQCRIVVPEGEPALVKKIGVVLSEDIERVTGVKNDVNDNFNLNLNDNLNRSVLDSKRSTIIIATVDHLPASLGVDVSDIKGCWERYKIVTRGNCLMIVGSDARGAAYGALHVSEKIGVSPWYWFADVPVAKKSILNYSENYISKSPTIKYRGIFINDEDWGLKTWAEKTFEKDLGDIGPKTYDKVCELLLRLKANMLAPAMHTCTGAFYSHPESQVKAAEWGIMITTSHCEPLLFNNAAPSEWSKERDGEWNYLTNKETIWKKLDDRIRETAQYDNIYTMGMRGLHDEAMKGSTDPKVRARTLEQVMADQRQILETHKKKSATEIPQIFVPYKETLDIYDAGLKVPEDITLVWPDDNYGYMKRVSNEAERQRKGGSGVYYHLSYLGVPHDNLWISTTAPVLMYEELKKAYDAGADRYWLLNVGDIKPMELEMQQFFDMAWDLSAFSYEHANHCQAQWLASIFGKQYEQDFQWILDHYYRLSWQRKPEFMGYEFEWDNNENSRLHDTDFSFETGTAQQRLADYKAISDRVDAIQKRLPIVYRPAFFEMLGYSVKGAYQMNRKFLMAQRNHETGSEDAAQEARAAFDSINALTYEYNTQLGGKWNQMISQIPPGYTAKYDQMPELVKASTTAYRLPRNQERTEFSNKLNMNKVKAVKPFRLIEGIGTDWLSLQLGEPLDKVQDPTTLSSEHIDLTIENSSLSGDSITLCISAVPFWPIATDCSNRFGVSVDSCQPVVCENQFEEWGWSWKLQVIENRKEFLVTLPLDRSKKRHTLSFIIGDPGQMIQKITYQ